MAHNFKLVGNVYVSKDGSDANSGLTPDLPKLTVQAGLNALTSSQTLVIGAGVYTENISRGTIGGYTIIGDGEVILDGLGIHSFALSVSLVIAPFIITDIKFINYVTIILTPYSNAPHTATLTNCKFINCKLYSAPATNSTVTQYIIVNKCVFVNSFLLANNSYPTTNPFANAYFYVYSSIFINTNTAAGPIFGYGSNYNLLVLYSSYVDEKSIISLITTGTNYNFNNIQGKIMTGAAPYNSIALSFADHRTYYPTYNVQSFSADPLFNDIQNLNFTLQSGSPHIRAANDYISNIGGTEYAVYKAANSTEFTSGATLTNVTLRGDNSYSITAGTEGRIVTAPISVQWPITKPLTRIEWAGGLEFNKSVTAGTAGNQNVPAYYTETTGAGASPDRLTVLMRYSTQQTQPSLSAEWDNGGYWTAGNWVEVELNTKPKIDANGIGNGDATYIEFSGLGDIAPSWIQLDIKLRNDYNP